MSTCFFFQNRDRFLTDSVFFPPRRWSRGKNRRVQRRHREFGLEPWSRDPMARKVSTKRQDASNIRAQSSEPDCVHPSRRHCQPGHRNDHCVPFHKYHVPEPKVRISTSNSVLKR